MTDTTNGWPGHPEAPRDPEKDGWHWVYNSFDGLVIRFWGATFSEWDGYPLWMAQEWTYLGPCLTPDEATALQARVAESKAALEKLARLGAEPYYGNSDGNMIARAALEGKKDE